MKFSNLTPMTDMDRAAFPGIHAAPTASRSFRGLRVSRSPVARARYGPWIGTVWIDHSDPTDDAREIHEWTVLLGGDDDSPDDWVIYLAPPPELQSLIGVNGYEYVRNGGEGAFVKQIVFLLQNYNHSESAAYIGTLNILGFKRR